ncbi:hypothetical protein H480_34971 [Amycolatopsis vancoresmycina DSM 44592]|uniref:Uncharacterized protein n=1 Tax=Amycolatopsis vancoresmycina DSM 44592 TaxID=1292037 RepID=R1HTZ4_9PSEU|nr:hypothetical protein H480_34971 [Amycolatopsis vancoresmycina DSM 44592]
MNAASYTYRLGDQVLVTEPVNPRSTSGSVNSCRDPMTVNTRATNIVGRIIGTLTDHAVRTPPAPSARAASSTSRGTACSAV